MLIWQRQRECNRTRLVYQLCVGQLGRGAVRGEGGLVEALASQVTVCRPKRGDKRNQSLNAREPDRCKIVGRRVPEMA